MSPASLTAVLDWGCSLSVVNTYYFHRALVYSPLQASMIPASANAGKKYKLTSRTIFYSFRTKYQNLVIGLT